MRFTVLTYGSEGDTRPLAALCRGLMDAGHAVRLFADRSTLASAEALGVPAEALAGDMKSTVAPDGALARLMREGGDANRTAKAVARIANAHTADWMRAAVADAATADAVLFSGIASYVGLAAGEHLDKPAIGLGLWPISPTRERGRQGGAGARRVQPPAPGNAKAEGAGVWELPRKPHWRT